MILKITDWLHRLRSESKSVAATFSTIYGPDDSLHREKLNLLHQSLQAFGEALGFDRPVFLLRAPARVNLMGVHVDHQGGYTNYVVVDRDLFTVVSPQEDDRVVVRNYDGQRYRGREFSISQEIPPRQRGDWLSFIEKYPITPGDWVNYIKAGSLVLQDQFADRSLRGMKLLIHGDIPPSAGLSSSAALVLLTAMAIQRVNGLDIPPQEMIELCGQGEWFVGTRAGAGDHAAMVFGKRGQVMHTRFFPLQVDFSPLPAGYRMVICQSYREASKSAGAKDIFNERIASYRIGVLLIKKFFPQLAVKVERIGDLNLRNLSLTELAIFQLLQKLPNCITRQEIRKLLPDREEELKSVFQSHREPREGYRVREVCLFGVAECHRSARFKEVLRKGDLADIGEMMFISHDGDRRWKFASDGSKVPWYNDYSDESFERLVRQMAGREEFLHTLPGGYRCSCEELDELVDLARSVEGVVGASLTGGGLGGCMVILVKEANAQRLLEVLSKNFYEKHWLPVGCRVHESVNGAGPIDF